jgi:hypothetical protein
LEGKWLELRVKIDERSQACLNYASYKTSFLLSKYSRVAHRVLQVHDFRDLGVEESLGSCAKILCRKGEEGEGREIKRKKVEELRSARDIG